MQFVKNLQSVYLIKRSAKDFCCKLQLRDGWSWSNLDYINLPVKKSSVSKYKKKYSNLKAEISGAFLY